MQRVRSVRVALAVAWICALSACTDQVGSSQGAIYGGSASTDGRVVAVTTTNNLCSGVAIGPRHVLTMRACLTVDGSADGALLRPSNIMIVTSEDVRDGSPLAVLDVLDGGGTDITAVGVVRLVAPDAGLTAVSLATSAPAMGDPVTLIGYGRDTNDVGGVRQAGSANVASVDADGVRFTTDGDAAVCRGDAGGAVLDASDMLVGLAYGAAGDCPSVTSSLHRRADVLAALVADAVAMDFPPDAGPPVRDAGASGDGGAGSGADAGSVPPSDDGGCAIRRAGARDVGWGWTGALLALALVRRRRRGEKGPCQQDCGRPSHRHSS